MPTPREDASFSAAMSSLLKFMIATPEGTGRLPPWKAMSAGYEAVLPLGYVIVAVKVIEVAPSPAVIDNVLPLKVEVKMEGAPGFIPSSNC